MLTPETSTIYTCGLNITISNRG